MPYQTPITDRAQSDVLTPTSRGYFNASDWERIYSNARMTSALAEVILETTIQFDTIAAQSRTSDPSTILTSLNTLLANIERMRLAIVGLIPTLTEIKDDWEAGAGKPSPDYTHVNQWERTIDAAWAYLEGDDLEVCPVLTENLTIAPATQYIVVDCIDPDDYEIIIEGTGVLYVI